MSPLAIALVLSAGLIHATWNLVSKKTSAGAGFVMIYSALACVLYAPVALYAGLDAHWSLDFRSILLITMSGGLHFAYAILLQRGYQRADLGIVYPVARGTGPLLSTLAAAAILGEQPVWSGCLIIVAGIVMVGLGRSSKENVREGISYGLRTGIFIAMYTIVDALAVTAAALPPILVDYLSNLIRTLLLLPSMYQRRSALAETFRDHRRACIVVALLMPLSYIFVLTAMRMAPLSHVAPMREVSVLFGVLGGSVFLGEPLGARRLIGSLAIAAGVVILTTH